MSDQPFIVMAKEAWDRMWDYVELMPGEVGCWGWVEHYPEDNCLFVHDIFLVPQEADASQVDFVSEGLPYAIQKTIDEKGPDGLNLLRFCIHSHGNAGAFWSSTDEQMIRTMGESGTPWLASVIFNKKGETKARLDVFPQTDFGKLHHTYKDIGLFRERTREHEDALIADLERFVKEPPKKQAKNAATKDRTVAQAATEAAAGMLTQSEHDNLMQELGDLVEDDFLCDLTFERMENLAKAKEWESIDDSSGVRWYYDPDSNDVKGCAQIPGDYAGEDIIEGTATEIDERTLGVTSNS